MSCFLRRTFWLALLVIASARASDTNGEAVCAWIVAAALALIFFVADCTSRDLAPELQKLADYRKRSRDQVAAATTHIGAALTALQALDK